MRRLLAAIAAVMAFFACMTPGAIYLRAKIAILEHNAADAMRAAGEQLAPGQNARLLSPAELDALQSAASANITAAVLLSLLVIAAGYVVFRGKPILTWLLAAGFVAMLVPLVAMGYQITVPFLVLGGVAAMGSTFVFTIFAKARSLDVNAS